MNSGWRNNYLRQRRFFLDIARTYRERADIRVYLEILLSLLTVSIFSIFALRPTILTIAQLLKEIEGKQDVLSRMNEKISNLAKAQVLYDQERDKIALLEFAVPTYPKPDIISAQLHRSIQLNGIDYVSLSTDETPLRGLPKRKPVKGEIKIDNGKITPFNLNVSTPIANYPKMANLISDLEKLRLPLFVKSFTMSTTKQDKQDILVLTLDGGFPYFNKDENDKAGESSTNSEKNDATEKTGEQ